MTDLYGDYVMEESVPYQLAGRDFEEAIGKMGPEEIVADQKLLLN